MTEEKRKIMRERVNLRCFYLRLMKKLWVIPAAAALYRGDEGDAAPAL